MKIKINLFHIIANCIILLFCSCEKEEYGSVIGCISDAQTGESLEGVSITLSPGNKSVTTNEYGNYAFEDLYANTYEILVSKKGYQKYTSEITVIAEAEIRKNIQIEPLSLELSTNELYFESGSTSKSFDIINNSGKTINWNILGLDKINWLEIKPTSGILEAGKKNALGVNILRDYVNERKETVIIINTNKETIDLKIVVEADNKNTKIALSENTLNFGQNYSSLNFNIKNIGNAGNVDWSITGIDAEWINVTPMKGTTAMGKSSAIKVNVDRNKMDIGEHSTTFLINADGESFDVTVYAEKQPNRYLEVTPSALVLGTNKSATIAIMSHNGDTNYELYSNDICNWIRFNKTKGTIFKYDPEKASSIESIIVTVDHSGLASGEYSTNFIIRSDLEDIKIPVTMVVPEEEDNSNIVITGGIISCDKSLSFSINNCSISGNDAILELIAENNGNTTCNLDIKGGIYDSYAYDDQGYVYTNSDIKIKKANNSYSSHSQSFEIPEGVKQKIFIQISNIHKNSAIFQHIIIRTNKENNIIIKDVSINGRLPEDLPSSKTSGNITTCHDKLDCYLVDCKQNSDYITLDFRITNTDVQTKWLELECYMADTYDDLGNLYKNNIECSFNQKDYSSFPDIGIPSKVTIYCSLIFSNIDTSSNELTYITIPTNQSQNLVFKNVKIRR